MAATPRKFQEKIALINERAAKGTAAYEEIMQEVSSLRSQPRIISQQQQCVSSQQTQPMPSRTAYSGSLPDFSINLSQNRTPGYFYPCPQQGAVSDLISLTQMFSSGSGCVEPISVLGSSRPHPPLQNSTIHSAITHRHSHLSPPDMLSRSSSDSSLHQTAYQNKMSSSYCKGFGTENDRHSQLGSMAYQMPKSSGDPFPCTKTPVYNHLGRSSAKPIPTTVGNPCGAGPGAGPGGGSLPDLTHVQFIQPMPMPLPDLDAINQTSFVGGSPQRRDLSHPGSFPRMNGPYMGRPTSSRGTSPGPSPRPSPSMDRKQKTKPYSQPPSLSSHQRLSSSGKAIVTDNSIIHTAEPHIPNSSGLNIFGRPYSPAGSHPTSPMPFPLMEYRNPGSPQISPCASPVPAHMKHQTGQMQYRCSSPDSKGSAPPSPVSLQQSSSPASSPGATLVKPFVYETLAQTQAIQLDHQFQQITVQSSHSDQLEPCGGESGGSSASPSPSSAPSAAHPPSPSVSPNLPPSPQIFSPHQLPSSPSHIPPSPSHPSSPLHSPTSPGGGIATPLSHPPATPQTPLTPNVALPRLVVTDQDGTETDKDLLLNDVSVFPFIIDDNIFRNLSSLGEEDMMAVDQILVDTETEESFRRDLRNPMMNQDLFPMDEMSQFLPQSQPQQQQQQQQPPPPLPPISSTACQTMPISHSPINIPTSMHQLQQQQQSQHLQQQHHQQASQHLPQQQLHLQQQHLQQQSQSLQQQLQQQPLQSLHQQLQQPPSPQLQQHLQQQPASPQQLQQQPPPSPDQLQHLQQQQQPQSPQLQQHLQQPPSPQQLQQHQLPQLHSQSQHLQQSRQQSRQLHQSQQQQMRRQSNPQETIGQLSLQTQSTHQPLLTSPTQLSQSLDPTVDLSVSPPILTSLEPLSEVTDTLLSYAQLQGPFASSPTEYSSINQVELELHSAVFPQQSLSTSTGSPGIGWQQISEPNPQL